MNVSLTPELERFVEQRVKSGLYQTASEVVRDGLRLLAEREQLRQIRLKELRTDIKKGLDQADRGEVVPLEEVTLERVREQGRARRAQAKKP